MQAAQKHHSVAACKFRNAISYRVTANALLPAPIRPCGAPSDAEPTQRAREAADHSGPVPIHSDCRPSDDSRVPTHIRALAGARDAHKLHEVAAHVHTPAQTMPQALW